MTGAARIASQSPGSAELDAVVGAWQLDLAQSRFTPGPPPKAEVRVYEPDHEGLKTVIRTQHADGRTTTVEYIASYNDVIAAVTGSATVDAVQMKESMTSRLKLSCGRATQSSAPLAA